MRRLLLCLLFSSAAHAGTVGLYLDTTVADTVAPAAVGAQAGTADDLVASSPSTTSIRLDYVAVGDDGLSGAATTCDVRYVSGAATTCTDLNTDGKYDAATTVTGEPTPALAGTAQGFTLSGSFTAGHNYVFAMKCADERGSPTGDSALSNCTGVTIPTAPAGCPTQDYTLFWRAESATLTSGTLDYSAGDTVAIPTTISGAGVTINAASVKNGTNGVFTDSSNDYYTLSNGLCSGGTNNNLPCPKNTCTGGACVYDKVMSGTKGCAGAWFKWPNTFPGANREIIAGRRDTSGTGSSDGIQLKLSGSTNNETVSAAFVNSLDGTTLTITSGTVHQVMSGNFYYGEVCWDASQAPGADKLVLKVYNSGLTVIPNAGASNTAATLTPISNMKYVRVGSTNGGAAEFYTDHFLLTSDPLDDTSLCANQGNYNGS
jgi:hypothetical protein